MIALIDEIEISLQAKSGTFGVKSVKNNVLRTKYKERINLE